MTDKKKDLVKIRKEFEGKFGLETDSGGNWFHGQDIDAHEAWSFIQHTLESERKETRKKIEDYPAGGMCANNCDGTANFQKTVWNDTLKQL